MDYSIKIIGENNTIIIDLIKDNISISYAILDLYSINNKKYALINSETKKEFQGCGYNTIIRKECIEYCIKNNIDYLCSNAISSCSFYLLNKMKFKYVLKNDSINPNIFPKLYYNSSTEELSYDDEGIKKYQNVLSSEDYFSMYFELNLDPENYKKIIHDYINSPKYKEKIIKLGFHYYTPNCKIINKKQFKYNMILNLKKKK